MVGRHCLRVKVQFPRPQQIYLNTCVQTGRHLPRFASTQSTDLRLKRLLRCTKSRLEDALATLKYERENTHEAARLYRRSLSRLEKQLLEAKQSYNIRGAYAYTMEQLGIHFHAARRHCKTDVALLLCRDPEFVNQVDVVRIANNLQLADVLKQVLGMSHILSTPTGMHGNTNSITIGNDLALATRLGLHEMFCYARNKHLVHFQWTLEGDPREGPAKVESADTL
ncbi:hypothetical protein DFH06DRAFT_3056 [Mycena polygramma]|nr:hypothetical protein DFH06DRAFT_3056 [Mycena polygramma]